MASGSVMLHVNNTGGGDHGNAVVPRRSPSSSSSQRTSCECCPYGYHIDLDFVRYCEAFKQPQNPASKLRQRRRQRHSMEVLLGLTSPTVWQLEQQLPQVPQEEEEDLRRLQRLARVQSHSTGGNASVLRDALHKAVLDFEETLQRSKRRPSPSGMVDSSTLPAFEPIRRSSSTSSLGSSLSDDLRQHRSSGGALLLHANDKDAWDAASIGSAASGYSTGALQNVREQMAKSLEKMREMEEKLTLIPILQSQLATLKEEKRLMLLQLKAGEAERNKLQDSLNQQSDELRDRVEKLSDRGLATPRLQRKFCVNEKEGSVGMGNTEVRFNGSAVRDVGVECCVLTRDIGVTHAGPKLRSIGVQMTPPPPSPLGFSAVLSENIPPGVVTKGEPKVVPPPKPIVKSTAEQATNTTGSDTRHASCGTEVRVFTETEVEAMLESHASKVLKEEEAARTRRRVEKGVVAKPRLTDTGVLATMRTRDAASSDCTINDVLCDKCNVRKRSVGVGSAGFLRPSPLQEGSLALENITMTRSKSSDCFNMRPRLRPTSSKGTDTRDFVSFRDASSNTARVAVSTRDSAVNTTRDTVTTRDAAVNTARDVPTTRDTAVNTSRDVVATRDYAVNTTKCKLVDTGVQGERVPTRDECVETMAPPPVLVTECSRCNARHPPSPSPSPSPSGASRIPRLAKPIPCPAQTSKRPFHRQDTYTKLSIDTQISSPAIEITPAECSSKLTSNHEEGASASAASTSENRLSAAGSGTEEPSEDDEVLQEEDELYSGMPGGPFYQAARNKIRKKAEPSKEMRGAMKVLSDSLKKSPRSEIPPNLKNAVNIIQQEWFKISSTATANPLDVEDYLDCFEEISGQLLEHIVNMPDNSGNTAMHYAVSHGNFDVVSILLDSKVCNINQANQAGYTSVMLVSLAQMRSETDSQVVQRLFQLADVNVRAKQHGQTALMLAASHGRQHMANMLLAAGADVNIQDDDGSTALMCASEHGHVEMVRLLLAQPDCDASITDHDGSTALNIAMEAGHRDVGVLLYAHQHFSSRGSSPYSSLKLRRPKT